MELADIMTAILAQKPPDLLIYYWDGFVPVKGVASEGHVKSGNGMVTVGNVRVRLPKY